MLSHQFLKHAPLTSLLSQPSCQGQFLSNGTCWIQISSRADNPCVWGYFLVWVFTFYITSAAVIAYAYIRITRGLESTYITRFRCVQDTFWFVAHYFAYGCVVGLLFFITVYVLPKRGENSNAVLKAMENVCVYVIACRGYFDSLIWFFSHNSSLQPLQIKTSSKTDLKGAGIFTRISFIFNRNDIEEDSEIAALTREQLLSGDSQTTTTDARSGDGKSTAERYTDYDLSPQLNFALRSELLLLVSMGIKESVMRLRRDYNYTTHTVDEEGKGSSAAQDHGADHASLINGIPPPLPCKSTTCHTN